MKLGAPEPSVLFAQTFVHPTLDEYVDEVLFAEPVVISACEILEQNSPSTCSAVKLSGASSPPSFALEVFVHCEGESRFRRLCQPFLYSHSSSNVLEVEAMVTSHLVMRGSYRSLSLVIYGNTAGDLGQFSIEVDLDNSLTHTVNEIEGDLEDLPPALHSNNFTIGESLSTLNKLSLKVVQLDVAVEVRQYLQLMFQILESPNLARASDRVISSVLSVALAHANPNLYSAIINQQHFEINKSTSGGEFDHVINEAKKELFDLYKDFHESEFSATDFLESEADVTTSKQLVDTLSQYFQLDCNARTFGHPMLSKGNNAELWLCVALLLCSARDSCFHFVNAGGMEKLGHAFNHDIHNSPSLRLLLLGCLEQATRHSIGCEGFLGWWPREDEKIPLGTSEGYNRLLKLLLQNQRHDVASLVTHILNRLRFYEVASRYEFVILSILGGLSAAVNDTEVMLDLLSNARVQLKQLSKLLSSSGPIEDPSLVSRANNTLALDDNLLSYKATSSLIAKSNCSFLKWDIDLHLLSLLKERGFLPLSAAFLSCSSLRTETGHVLSVYMDTVSCIESIILSLLCCRSGLTFLLSDPDMSTTIIRALRGGDDWNINEPTSLRYASILISRGYFCHPQEVGFIVETHLKAISAIDRLITATPNTEEFLWTLWELCSLSRSDCDRQALLSVIHFPEALSVLMAALHSMEDSDAVNSGSSALNIAIFHAASEILEVIVTDTTASSLCSWIDHANELHKVLHLSSPGSNRKDAPSRLLEWIDAGVVYHKNGAIGLLRYAALLASGSDTHMASTRVLASDVMDADNVLADISGGSDSSIIDSLLGKRITEKDFPGVILRDSSIFQLTTAFRILAFISDNPAVSASLYDEGAVMVIHAVLINCKVMLERSSNTYDYLVDEGTECNATSDILLERNRERGVTDLLIPSLVLLLNLLKKLQGTKEQHRNKKLVTSLVQLHRELSPRLAACPFDLSYPQLEALGFEAVCHLIVSALACWPVYGWAPGLFHFLLDNLHAASSLVLGPKEICSLFCLLNDLFPCESVHLWKNGLPMLSVVREVAVGTFLGPHKEKQINWYMQTGHCEKLLGQLIPQLEKVAPIILNWAVSTVISVQDVLRIFIVRVACHNTDNASVLLRPVISWISSQLSTQPTFSETDSYKVYRMLDFLALLLEHPCAKPLVLRENGTQMFIKVLERCNEGTPANSMQNVESSQVAGFGFSGLAWCLPVFKSISLLFDGRASLPRSGTLVRNMPKNVTSGECLEVSLHLLKICKVLPVGKEMIACLSAFKELGSSAEGRSALLSIFVKVQSSFGREFEVDSRHGDDGSLKIMSAHELRDYPPLRVCWNTLLASIASGDGLSENTVEAIGLLCSGALIFCMDQDSLNLERVAAIKCLFGVKKDGSGADGILDESMKTTLDLASLFGPEVMKSVDSLLLLLQKPIDTIKVDDFDTGVFVAPRPVSSRILKIVDGSTGRIEELELGEFGDKFTWECPESGASAKRKMSSLDGGPSRRARTDNASVETTTQNTFLRGPATSLPPAPSRRDSFRQRKPNTSRPPSMHVDAFVARERSVDGSNIPNVVAAPRLGSGRPPSIHVDEFMARQRDRQTLVGSTVSEVAAKGKTTAPESSTTVDKSSKSRHLKPDLDDDIPDIIFDDAEESELDDKAPFPRPDDSLPPAVVEQNSPHSVVAESDANDSNQFSLQNANLASPMDDASEFSSRMSASRPDKSLTREPSISSEKKFPDPSAPFSRANTLPSQMQTTNNPYSRVGVHQQQRTSDPASARDSKGFYDKRVTLPPLPPPPAMSLPMSQSSDPFLGQSAPYINSMSDMQPPPGFHVQTDYLSSYRSGQASISSPGGSTRPPPPLPPTPPPYSGNPSSISLSKPPPSPAQNYNQALNYRPHNIENPAYISQNPPMSMPSIQAIPSFPLRPLQPPQQHSQSMRPRFPVSPQAEQGGPMMQNALQMPLQPMPVMQQPQIPLAHLYQQTPQIDNIVQQQQQQFRPQQPQQQGDGTSQQQDAGTLLQEIFKSPEAIQSLISDREKLTLLLEQHPKIMEMLQEQLG